jgi:Sortase domain
VAARRPALAALLAAALGLALAACGGRVGGGATDSTGAVDNRAPSLPSSATLPVRGPTDRELGGPEAARAPGGPAPGGAAPGASAPAVTAPGGTAPAATATGGSDLGATAPGATANGTPSNGRFDLPAEPPRPPGFEVGELPSPIPASASAPVRLLIPAIGVATPLLRLGLEPGGAMQVPGDFGRAGWFAKGPAPGQVGPAVIAGHVDSRTGPAVFFRLRELRPGQLLLVERADGTRLRFTVEAARSFPKARFPTAAVFGPVPTPALRLITCAGDFDPARGSYLDNLVVFAALAGTERGNRG